MKNYFLVFLLIFLAACGAGSGEGLDDNGNPLSEQNNSPEPQPEPEPEPAEEGVTLADLVDTIFDNQALGDQRCTNCHSGGSPLGGLNLSSVELAYANLVGANGEGVDANGNASFKRVQPGNPDESYIILKLEGDSRAGSQMPLGEAPLTQDQINAVRDWIANGAPAGGGGSAPTVVSKVSAEKNQLSVRFSRPVNSGTLEQDLQVYFENKNTSWLADSNEYELILSDQEVRIRFLPWVADVERVAVVLNDEKIAAIYDSRGRLLDGDKDNIDGGAFRYEYTF